MNRVFFIIRALSVIALLSFTHGGVAAVSLQVENGKLIGATGVSVAGRTYDVSFADGSCNSLFDGCKSEKFAFNNAGDAQAASHALYDLVLDGIYDRTPALINGCSHYLDCSIYTPYMTGVEWGNNVVFSTVFLNSPSPEWDSSNLAGSLFYWADQTSLPRSVFAVWQLSSPVPEPDIAVLFCAGLGWFGLVRRYAIRRKSRISDRDCRAVEGAKR